MSRLTLNVDEKVIRGAKRYAAARGTSVSQLVERYLALLAQPADVARQPPVLKLLRGAARGQLSDDDPFLEAVDEIVFARAQHRPRTLRRKRVSRKP
jgi:hypothetical protein